MKSEPATTASTEPDRYLAQDDLAATLTRLEMAMIRSTAAFSRWAPELHKLVTGDQLGMQDTAVLHCIRLRGGSTTLAEMMMFLNRHDLASIQYSLRKLERSGLVRKAKGPQRREIYYSITDRAREHTELYAARRYEILIELCREVTGLETSIASAAAVLERLTGIYDQAIQTVLNQSVLSASHRRRGSNGS
jgi:predicted MarR family transcription regulator